MLFSEVPFRGIPSLCCFALPCGKPVPVLQLFSLPSQLAGCAGILWITEVLPEAGKHFYIEVVSLNISTCHIQIFWFLACA